MLKLARLGVCGQKKTNMTKMFLFNTPFFFFCITQPGNVYLAFLQSMARGETQESRSLTPGTEPGSGHQKT